MALDIRSGGLSQGHKLKVQEGSVRGVSEVFYVRVVAVSPE